VTESGFGAAAIAELIDAAIAGQDWSEHGSPRMVLSNINEPGTGAGHVRLWQARQGCGDRMIHFRLHAGPVDTQLLFLFGRPDSVLPHLHFQVVQFAADACVFNADLLPRLDPIDYPDYFTELFSPLNKAFWKATGDWQNACSHAPGNPAIALYLSPWSIGAGRPTSQAELQRVQPAFKAYLEHWLTLSKGLDYAGPDAALLRERDQRHLRCFLAESLDPRAWKGVYRIVGEETGQQIREIIKNPLY